MTSNFTPHMKNTCGKECGEKERERERVYNREKEVKSPDNCRILFSLDIQLRTTTTKLLIHIYDFDSLPSSLFILGFVPMSSWAIEYGYRMQESMQKIE